ncbi:putative eucaryotic stearoyl-CoA 9-desaturase [Chlamydiales bacterium STE3]|nr:putative eucaryotic stearoyl-CoA 9-desaturase [Chlamydiales bacterium STE3]
MMINTRNFNWGPGLFLILYQILFLTALPFYFYYNIPSTGLILSTVILFFLTGLSITGGYHRYYSHRCYKLSKPAEAVVLFFATMAGQGSALRWAYDHRMHHAFVDTDKDPYSIKKGFWYAHFLWILEKPKPIDPKVVSDLLENPLVVWQDRFAARGMFVTNFLAFLFVGWLLNDYLGAFFIALWARLFLLHHFTWFINSLAHTWGDKPFSQEQSAVNNYVISLVTFGEGYHNYHHTFANDYRNGIRWYHFDPTKWMIWTLSKFKIATNLRKIDDASIKKRLIIEHKRLLLKKLSSIWTAKKGELEEKVNALSERLLEKIARANELKSRFQRYQSECTPKEMLMELRADLSKHSKSLKRDFALWWSLSRDIMNLKSLRN